MASSGAGQVDAAHKALSNREIDLERKRARDRKSQQAMRDRTKWTVHSLTEQVNVLTKALEEQSKHTGLLSQRLQSLEAGNEHLRVQNAALRLSLLGDPSGKNSLGQDGGTVQVPVWKLPPNNTSPSCLADSILQGVVNRKRGRRESAHSNAPSPATSDSLNASKYLLKPNLCALIDKDLRADDEISNIVSDIIRSYTEIEAFPNQVAVAYIMATLLRWQVLLDELTTPHAAWIDRMPWPKIRDYLIAHPEITIDDIATVYSSSFFVRWQYDPSHILITIDEQSKAVITNPIYEEHVRQLKNWDVSERFRRKFPELAELIDEDKTGT